MIPSKYDNADVAWCIENKISFGEFAEFCKQKNIKPDNFSLKYFIFRKKQAIKNKMESPFSTLDGYFVVWRYKSGADGKIFTLSEGQCDLLFTRLTREFNKVEKWKRVQGKMIRLA